MLKKSVSLVLITLSLGSLASCGKKVAERPVDTVKPATTGAMTTTGNKPLTTSTGTLAVVPAGVTIDTDLQQELSSGKIVTMKHLRLKSKMVLLVNIQL